MKLLSCWRFQFGRKTSKKVPDSYDDFQKYKLRHFQRYSTKYESDQQYQHEDKFYEEFVYGNTVHIAGLTPFNSQSLKYAKSMMKWANPHLLLLGGLSDNYLRLQESRWKIRKHYQHPIHRPQKMQCKQRISRIIQARLQQDPDLLWDDRKKQMMTINHNDKRMVPHQNYTVAHMASMDQQTKVVLGKPSETLVFEDLIMRYSVQQLRGIAERAIDKVKSRKPKQQQWRLSQTREAVQNYVMSEQSQIFSRQLTYQAALLKRYAKIQDKILMFVPGYFAQRIASQVHHVQTKPENIFREGLNDPTSQAYNRLQKIMNGDPQEVLQKFCILSLIKQSWMEFELAHGTNVFKYMCFGKLFQDMEMDELVQRYMKAKRATEGKWYELMQQRVNNVHIEPRFNTRMSLAQQFQVIQERSTKHFPYTYEEKNYLSIYEDKVKMIQIQQKMRELLNQEGDKHQIQLFDKFKRGYRTKQGIILYSKILGKANIQVQDRIKLPIFHYGGFRGIYKEYLRQFLLTGEQNTKKMEKVKKRQQKIEDIMQKHMKKLDNPDELHKYVTGKKGRTLQIGFDAEQGPQFAQDDIQEMKQMFGQLKPEDQQQMRQQFGEDWYKIEGDQK